jgi:hypothetical protein
VVVFRPLELSSALLAIIVRTSRSSVLASAVAATSHGSLSSWSGDHARGSRARSA